MNGSRRVLGMLALGLPMLLPALCAAGQSAPGAIEGTISYPSEEVPAMHVYAIPLDGRPARRVDTDRAQLRFLIEGLSPGAYHIIAFPVGAGGDAGLVGAWTDFVTCGMTAECLQHDLLPVEVTAGKATGGVQIDDWYASPDSFPTEAALIHTP